MQVPKEHLEIQPYRGGLALIGISLDTVIEELCPDIQLPLGHPLHITLVSATEYKAAGRPVIPSISVGHIYALTWVTKSGVSWIIIVWNHADIWRKTIGLPPKDYHVTLSEVDDLAVDKGLGGVRDEREVNCLARTLEAIGEEAMDHTWAKASSHLVSNLFIESCSYSL